jgi:hypothetical protein
MTTRNNALLSPEAPEFYFWLRHARRSQEPIVLLNAGTGRVAIPLAEQSIGMIAVEGDEGKRQQGSEESQARGVEIRWQEGQPEDFSLPRKVGMIGMPDETFQELLTLEAQRAALGNIYKRLQIGGKLILVLSVPDVQAMAASQRGAGGTLRRQKPLVEPKSGQTIYLWQASHYNLVQQQLSRHLVYEQVDDTGSTLRRWHRTEQLAYLSPREMQLLLEGMRFEIEALYSGWNDEPFTETSTKQIWVARKGI